MNSTKANHIVFGAGLVGCFLYGNLINNGVSASILARPRIQTTLRKGIHLSDYLGNGKRSVQVSLIDTQQAKKTVFEFFWLTTKCTALASALEDAAPFVGKSTIIIACQNGIGSDQLVRERFPENLVINAIIGFNVANPEAGHYHRSTEGELIIEDSKQVDTTALANVLNSPLMPTRTSRNIEAEQWSKLQLNLGNAVNALSDIPLKAMLEQRGFRLILATLMKELLTVANLKGIKLPKITSVPPRWLPKLLALPDWLFTTLARKMLAIDESARLSMWWDLSQNKATEIDYLNGAVVEEGSRVGIDCTANRVICELVKQVEAGEASIGFTAKQLLERIENG